MKSKKILSIALALLMLCSVALPAFASGGGAIPVKQYKSYMVMGDSNACGANLDGYNFFENVENSYPDQVAEAVGSENYYPLRAGGLRVSDVLYMLGKAPSDFDEENSALFHAESTLGDLSIWELMQDVKAGENPRFGDLTEAVRSTDLFTIAFGSVELSYYPMYESIIEIIMDHPELRETMDSNLVGEIFGTAQEEGGSTEEIDLSPYYLPFITRYLELSQKGYNELLRNYPKLIRLIKQLNPDAEIYLLGVFNPTDGKKLIFQDSPVGVGDAITAVYKSANAYIKTLALTYGCKYVDLDGIYDYDISSGHPQKDGYDFIARQVINALPRVDKKVLLPKEGEMRLEFAGTNVGSLSFDKNALGYKITAEAKGSLCLKNGTLSYSENGSIWWFDGGFYTIGKVQKDTRFGFSYLSFVKEYLTADDDGSLALSHSRIKAAMYVNK